MSSGDVALLGWGSALIAIALLGTTVFGLAPLPTLLLSGAGAACVVVGALTRIAERRRPRIAGKPDVLLRSSAATLVVTAGATLVLVGAAIVGPALLWPGVGFVIAGAGGLVRELRAQRRLLRDARRGSGR